MQATVGDLGDASVTRIVDTYGRTAWESFFLLMQECDKDIFEEKVQRFRLALRTHKQSSLLQYFDREYFTRPQEWALWYREQLTGTKWLINTNMHVESWHNQLKTVILERKRNFRLDTLIIRLKQAEIRYFVMWERLKNGEHIYMRNKEWQRFSFDHDKPVTTASPDATKPHDGPRPPSISFKVSSSVKSESTRLQDQRARIRSELLTQFRLLSNDKLFHNMTSFSLDFVRRRVSECTRVIRAQLSSSLTHVTTTGFVTRSDHKDEKTFKSVKDQYSCYRKRRRVHGNHISVSHLKSNSLLSDNHFLSYALNQPGGELLSAPTAWPKTECKTVTLSVARKQGTLLAGGITFTSSPGGLVIPLSTSPRKMESLHVRVRNVVRKSKSHELGIHNKMWLRSVAIVNRSTQQVSVATIIGASQHRHPVNTKIRTQLQEEEDIWRSQSSTPLSDDNSLNMISLMNMVDQFMIRSFTDKVELQLVLQSVVV